MQSFSGTWVYPLDPIPEEIEIKDIAHALSNLCRFGGHTTQFYSVAQHSLIMSTLVSRRLALEALLHDASEAYLVDIPRPIKAHLSEYRGFEDAMQRCIADKYGLIYPWPNELKDMDEVMLALEHRTVMTSGLLWDHDKLKTPNIDIPPLSNRMVEVMFLERFNKLFQERAHGK
jgi:hypothetical protein